MIFTLQMLDLCNQAYPSRQLRQAVKHYGTKSSMYPVFRVVHMQSGKWHQVTEVFFWAYMRPVIASPSWTAPGRRSGVVIPSLTSLNRLPFPLTTYSI